MAVLPGLTAGLLPEVETTTSLGRRVDRACQRVIFHTVEIAKQFIERAKTTTGLRVTVSVLEQVYATGRTYAKGFKQTMKIIFDDHLPRWNYRAIPESG